MNRKKWALLSALLLATVAPLPTLTPPQLIPAVSAKQHIESLPGRDTDGDPEEYSGGKPGVLRPPQSKIDIAVEVKPGFHYYFRRVLLLLFQAGRVG